MRPPFDSVQLVYNSNNYGLYMVVGNITNIVTGANLNQFITLGGHHIVGLWHGVYHVYHVI